MEACCASWCLELAYCEHIFILHTFIALAVVLSVRLEKCKTLGFATPVLDLMHMLLQHINNTDNEKQKYIHHEAPIYTEMYTQGGRRVFFLEPEL